MRTICISASAASEVGVTILPVKQSAAHAWAVSNHGRRRSCLLVTASSLLTRQWGRIAVLGQQFAAPDDDAGANGVAAVKRYQGAGDVVTHWAGKNDGPCCHLVGSR